MQLLFPDLPVRIAIFLIELVLTLTLTAWIRHNQLHKEPFGFFGRLLLYGGVAALVSAVVEIRYSLNLQELEAHYPSLAAQYGPYYDLINNASASMIEELAKYVVALFTVASARHIHKLSDAITYLILIGLGFALIEDVVFLLNPDIIAPYRLLSFFLHSGTSAIMGYSLGRFMSGIARYPELIWSVLGAIGLHFAYNLSTTLSDGNLSFILTSLITIYISLQIFILFRLAIAEEYRLGHRFRGETAQRLLNL